MTCFHVFSPFFSGDSPGVILKIRRPVICWATCSRRRILGTAICVTEHILNHLCFRNIGKKMYSTFSAYQYSKILPMQKVLWMICDGYLDNFWYVTSSLPPNPGFQSGLGRDSLLKKWNISVGDDAILVGVSSKCYHGQVTRFLEFLTGKLDPDCPACLRHLWRWLGWGYPKKAS